MMIFCPYLRQRYQSSLGAMAGGRWDGCAVGSVGKVSNAGAVGVWGASNVRRVRSAREPSIVRGADASREVSAIGKGARPLTLGCLFPREMGNVSIFRPCRFGSSRSNHLDRQFSSDAHAGVTNISRWSERQRRSPLSTLERPRHPRRRPQDGSRGNHDNPRRQGHRASRRHRHQEGVRQAYVPPSRSLPRSSATVASLSTTDALRTHHPNPTQWSSATARRTGRR